MWNIVTGPGAIIALWAMERHGLRWSLLLGSITQLIGCIGSWASCVSPGLAPHSAYALLYSSQVLGAIGQPLVLNNIARVAGDWCASDLLTPGGPRGAVLPCPEALLPLCNTLAP